MSSPEAHLEVALEHQTKREVMKRRLGGFESPEEELMEHDFAVENNALLAIAGFLSQMHICDHGVRGWCPHCHRSLKEVDRAAGS